MGMLAQLLLAKTQTMAWANLPNVPQKFGKFDLPCTFSYSLDTEHIQSFQRWGPHPNVSCSTVFILLIIRLWLLTPFSWKELTIILNKVLVTTTILSKKITKLMKLVKMSLKRNPLKFSTKVNIISGNTCSSQMQCCKIYLIAGKHVAASYNNWFWFYFLLDPNRSP